MGYFPESRVDLLGGSTITSTTITNIAFTCSSAPTEHAKKVSNRLTQSHAFHRLVDWAYNVCDKKKTNHISSEQLYSGLLLVHLNLARFCGSAACMVSDIQVSGCWMGLILVG